MPEHRRKNDDAQESSVHARAEEEPTKKFLRTLTQYRILWLVGMGMAAWIGSRIVQPLNQIPIDTADIQELKKRADAKDSTDREWREVVKIVVRVQCNTLSDADKYKYNLCHTKEQP